jgi:hypothetical protein
MNFISFLTFLFCSVTFVLADEETKPAGKDNGKEATVNKALDGRTSPS